MGAKLISKFKMVIDDPSGGGDAWHFEVRVPTLAVVAELEAVYRPFEQVKRNAAIKIMSSPEVVEAAGGSDVSDPTALAGNQKLHMALIGHSDQKSVAEMMAPPPIGMQEDMAKLVLPFCDEPIGLEDEHCHVYTWANLEKDNAPYMTEVLYKTAVSVLDRTVGSVGKAQLKK